MQSSALMQPMYAASLSLLSMSQSPIPFHQLAKSFVGHSSGLIRLKRFSSMIQKSSIDNARFLDCMCLTSIGRQRMQAMAASVGRRIADDLEGGTGLAVLSDILVENS